MSDNNLDKNGLEIDLENARKKALAFFGEISGSDLELKLYNVYTILCDCYGLSEFNIGSSISTFSGTVFEGYRDRIITEDEDYYEDITISNIDLLQNFCSLYSHPSMYIESNGINRIGFGVQETSKEKKNFQTIYSREFVDIQNQDIWFVLYAYFIMNVGYNLDNLNAQEQNKIKKHLDFFNNFDSLNVIKKYKEVQLILEKK